MRQEFGKLHNENVFYHPFLPSEQEERIRACLDKKIQELWICFSGEEEFHEEGLFSQMMAIVDFGKLKNDFIQQLMGGEINEYPISHPSVLVLGNASTFNGRRFHRTINLEGMSDSALGDFLDVNWERYIPRFYESRTKLDSLIHTVLPENSIHYRDSGKLERVVYYRLILSEFEKSSQNNFFWHSSLSIEQGTRLEEILTTKADELWTEIVQNNDLDPNFIDSLFEEINFDTIKQMMIDQILKEGRYQERKLHPAVLYLGRTAEPVRRIFSFRGIIDMDNLSDHALSDSFDVHWERYKSFFIDAMPEISYIYYNMMYKRSENAWRIDQRAARKRDSYKLANGIELNEASKMFYCLDVDLLRSMSDLYANTNKPVRNFNPYLQIEIECDESYVANLLKQLPDRYSYSQAYLLLPHKAVNIGFSYEININKIMEVLFEELVIPFGEQFNLINRPLDQIFDKYCALALLPRFEPTDGAFEYTRDPIEELTDWDPEKHFETVCESGLWIIPNNLRWQHTKKGDYFIVGRIESNSEHGVTHIIEDLTKILEIDVDEEERFFLNLSKFKSDAKPEVFTIYSGRLERMFKPVEPSDNGNDFSQISNWLRFLGQFRGASGYIINNPNFIKMFGGPVVVTAAHCLNKDDRRAIMRNTEKYHFSIDVSNGERKIHSLKLKSNRILYVDKEKDQALVVFDNDTRLPNLDQICFLPYEEIVIGSQVYFAGFPQSADVPVIVPAIVDNKNHDTNVNDYGQVLDSIHFNTHTPIELAGGSGGILCDSNGLIAVHSYGGRDNIGHGGTPYYNVPDILEKALEIMFA